MRNIEIESHFISEDPSVIEDCLLELPPFGTFPMRGFRKACNDDLDLFLDEMTTAVKPTRPPGKNIAA